MNFCLKNIKIRASIPATPSFIRIRPSKPIFCFMISSANLAGKRTWYIKKDLAQEMPEHVTRQRESGLTVANYSKQAGIITTKLQY